MGILQVTNLRKTFGSVVAVEDISFTVQAGEVFTIIGPNGAGKTTTLEMIEGMTKPDQGEIRIMDMNWKQHEARIKQKIGIQPQTSALFDLLTVFENLDVFGSFYERQRSIDDILEMINLTDHKNKNVKSLSGGQKQRLAIGLAMINDPDILFLDEPTTGLDPQARRNIWDIVLKLKELGKTTILTTHYMEEAEKLSDRVCIVDAGKVIALDTPEKLIMALSDDREIRLGFENEANAASVEEVSGDLPNVTRVERAGANLTMWSTQPEESLYHLFRHTVENRLAVDQISIKDLSLEDVFISYTGKEWRD